MFPLLFVCFIFLNGFTSCSARHFISINSTIVEFSSLAWNPIAGHFVAGSIKGPDVYAIPDAGMVKCIISEPSFNSSNASVSAVAVDNTSLRLIVVFSNPSFVAVYDMKSYTRIFTVPLPELGGVSGGVAVDEESGEMFVSSAANGVVLKLGSEGNGISEFKIFDDEGFGGLVHIDQGYIIIAQPTTGKIFKVNSENGTATEVLSKNGEPLAFGGHGMVLSSNFSLFAATNQALVSIKSDSTWERAKVARNFKLRKEEMAVAVARREAATYVLVKSLKGYFRIEETKPNLWAPYGVILLGVGYGGFLCTVILWYTQWLEANVRYESLQLV